MTPGYVVNLVQHALFTLIVVSAPVLLTSLFLGLLVSILQAATQVNELTLTFIPKLLGIFFALMFCGSWMLSYMMDYTTRLILNIPTVTT